MVAAGHWAWFAPDPGLPLIPGVPLTNYAGWLLVSTVLMALLQLAIPRDGRRPQRPSGPAATLYLWVYASSVMAHAVFFGLPGSAITGSVIMGMVAIPSPSRSGGVVSDPFAPAGGPVPHAAHPARDG